MENTEYCQRKQTAQYPKQPAVWAIHFQLILSTDISKNSTN